MKYCYPFILFLCCLFCQNTLMAQQDKDLQVFYSDKLKTNGVFVSSDISQIPYVDIDRIATSNFDQYRRYDTRQQVVLRHGPNIELASIQERLAAGKTVDASIVAKKKSFPSASYSNQSMPIVDRGFGVKPPVREKDVVKYTALPKD
jgi:hypothetical protein